MATLSSSSTQQRSSLQKQAIERAREAFSRLPNGNEIFQKCITNEETIVDVVQTTVQKHQFYKSKRSSRLLERFQKYTLWLQNISAAVDVAVQAQASIACPIWAPIKFVLKVSNDHSEAAEKILTLIDTVSDCLPRFEIYEKLAPDPVLQVALLDVFTDVVEFSISALRYFRRTVAGRLTLTVKSSFKKELGNITDQLKRHAKVVDRTAVATELIKAAEFRKEAEAKSRQDQKVQCERWLRPANMREFHKHQVQLRLDGTCAWIWTHNTFQEWTSSTATTASDKILCIQGTQGCGKTVLASSLVESFSNQGQRTISFSFAATDGGRQKVDDCIRALLWQLLTQVNDDKSWDTMHGLMSKGQPLTSELWDAFDITAARLSDSLNLVLDGIDESTGSLQDLFDRLFQSLDAHPGLRGILLGRPHAFELLRSRPFSVNRTIEITSSVNKTDIDAFIRTEIGRSTILSSRDLRDMIFDTLVGKSDSMFLWVRLMIDDLGRSATKHEIMERLHKVPRKLEKAYTLVFSRLIEDLDNFDLRLARNVLSFAIVACRPLELEELRYALAQEAFFSSTSEEHDLQDHLLLDPAQKILDVCRGLVSLGPQGLQLIHSSVKEFLTRPEDEWPSENQEMIAFRVDESQTHSLLGSICLGYMRQSQYEFDIRNPDFLSELRADHPLLEYASRYVLRHFYSSEANSSEFIDEFKDFLRSRSFAPWLDLYTSFMVDQGSLGSEVEDYDEFLGWLLDGDQMQELSAILKIRLEDELASRIRRFGESDPRTTHCRYILKYAQTVGLVEPYTGNNQAPQSQGCHRPWAPTLTHNPSESSNELSLEDNLIPQDQHLPGTSGGVSQVLHILNSTAATRLDKRIEVLLRLQTCLRRLRTITDPLNLLFRLILQKAHIIPAWGLVQIGFFYIRVAKYKEALDVLAAALGKLDGKEVLLKYLIYHNMGYVHYKLGEYEQALGFFNRALDGRERLLGKNHLDTVRSKNAVGYTLKELKRFIEALEVLAAALADLNGKEVRLKYVVYSHIGEIHYCLRQYDHALSWHQQALNGREGLLGKDHLSTLYSKAAVGYTLATMGRSTEALDVLAAALETLDEKDMKLKYTVYYWSGYTRFDMHQYDEALCFFTQALDGEERLLGRHHLNTLTSKNAVGYTLIALERYTEALEVLVAALAGLEDKEVELKYSIFFHMGDVHSELRQYDQALSCYKEALVGRERLLETDDPDTLSARIAIGSTLAKMERFTEALEVLTAVLSQLEGEKADKRLRYTVCDWIGYSHYRMRQYDQSLSYDKQALDERETLLGEDHPDTLSARRAIGLSLMKLERFAEAQECFSKLLAIQRRVLGPYDQKLLSTVHELGRLAHDLGETDQASGFFEEWLDGKGNYYAANRADTIENSLQAGSIFCALWQLEKAVEVLQQALSQSGQNDTDRTSVSLKICLGTTYLRMGRMEDAEKLFRGLLEGHIELGTEAEAYVKHYTTLMDEGIGAERMAPTSLIIKEEGSTIEIERRVAGPETKSALMLRLIEDAEF